MPAYQLRREVAGGNSRQAVGQRLHRRSLLLGRVLGLLASTFALRRGALLRRLAFDAYALDGVGLVHLHGARDVADFVVAVLANDLTIVSSPAAIFFMRWTA